MRSGVRGHPRRRVRSPRQAFPPPSTLAATVPPSAAQGAPAPEAETPQADMQADIESASALARTEPLATLVRERRAGRLAGSGPGATALWVAAERVLDAGAARPDGVLDLDPAPGTAPPASPEDAIRELLRGRLGGLGPVTATTLAADLGIDLGAGAGGPCRSRGGRVRAPRTLHRRCRSRSRRTAHGGRRRPAGTRVRFRAKPGAGAGVVRAAPPRPHPPLQRSPGFAARSTPSSPPTTCASSSRGTDWTNGERARPGSSRSSSSSKASRLPAAVWEDSILFFRPPSPRLRPWLARHPVPHRPGGVAPAHRTLRPTRRHHHRDPGRVHRPPPPCGVAPGGRGRGPGGARRDVIASAAGPRDPAHRRARSSSTTSRCSRGCSPPRSRTRLRSWWRAGT